MSSHLDCSFSIVDNGNSDGNGSSFTKHHLRKCMKDFVEKMAIHNAFVKSINEVFLAPF
jgi:hypothetical protein